MTDCAPTTGDVGVVPEETPGEAVLPGLGETILVMRGNTDPPHLTVRRDCDAVTALKRGLSEYLAQVYVDVAGARVRFLQTFYSWAEPENIAVYPSCLVSASDAAEYDYHNFTPTLDPKRLVVNPDGPAGMKSYLVKYAELSVQLAVEIYCSSPEERVQISMMLEDALNPVDWMYGFKLDLPHYFNQRAVYEPVSTQFTDSEDSARRRFRPGTVLLNGQVSVLRVRSLPQLDPRAVVVVDSPNP